jgi:phosphoribosylamine--glycine ligase
VYPSNEFINLPADNESAKEFHAGTKMDGDNIVSSGGRGLCATAMGADTKDAQANSVFEKPIVNYF